MKLYQFRWIHHSSKTSGIRCRAFETELAFYQQLDRWNRMDSRWRYESDPSFEPRWLTNDEFLTLDAKGQFHEFPVNES